jgi:hypothetical protein
VPLAIFSAIFSASDLAYLLAVACIPLALLICVVKAARFLGVKRPEAFSNCLAAAAAFFKVACSSAVKTTF